MNRLYFTIATLLIAGAVSPAAYGSNDQDDAAISRGIVEEDSARQFAQNDHDGDGSITLDEWLKGADDRRLESGKRVFAKIDANRDLRITKPELTAWQYALFDCIDTNHDGTLQDSEVGKNITRCGTEIGGFDYSDRP